MNIEEAIKILKKAKKPYYTEVVGSKWIKGYTTVLGTEVDKAIETVLNELEKKDKELKESQKETMQIYSDYQDIGEKAQKLIEKLEENNKEDTESVKRYEEMRRHCQANSFYKKSYQIQIHKLNAKREVRKGILSILKGEKE